MILLLCLYLLLGVPINSVLGTPTNANFGLHAQYLQYDWTISCWAFDRLRRLHATKPTHGLIYETKIKKPCEQKVSAESVASDFTLEIKEISEQRNEYFCKTDTLLHFHIAANKKQDSKFIRVIFLLHENMGQLNGKEVNSWETVEIGVNCFLKHAKTIAMQENSNDDILPNSVSIFVPMPHIPLKIITSPECKITNSYIWSTSDVSVPKSKPLTIVISVIIVVLNF